MGAPIRRIIVLVGIEVQLGCLTVESPRFSNSPVRTLQAARQHEVDAINPQDAFSLLARILGQCKPDPIATRRADPAIGDSGITRRGVQDDLAWLQQSLSLPIEDHA